MTSFNQTELLARGWTIRRIKAFLGKPDFLYQARTPAFRNSATPRNGKAWGASRVATAELAGALKIPLGTVSMKPNSGNKAF